jgi:aromatic ring-cleaving dioxygenase
MGIAYTDKLDTAIGPNDKEIAIIAAKDTDGNFVVPMLKKGHGVSDVHIFHNAATAASDGTSTKLTLGGRDKVVLSISRSSITANVIRFHGTAPGDIVGYALGYRIGSDGSKNPAVSSDSLENEVWVFEGLAGYTDFYVSIESMTGTAITVTGHAVG